MGLNQFGEVIDHLTFSSEIRKWPKACKSPRRYQRAIRWSLPFLPSAST
jgi:hypothetical protein